MTVNMKPYDPEHKGEFCTRRGNPVELVKRDRKSPSGAHPLFGFEKRGGVEYAMSWTEHGTGDPSLQQQGPSDLMCVIPKREARTITLNGNGDFIRVPSKNGPGAMWADCTFREEMPDDISQEKARAVIEAAQPFLDPNLPTSERFVSATKLRAALGDDA